MTKVLFIAFFMAICCRAQTLVSVIDPAFRNYLVQNHPTTMLGDQLNTNSETLKSIETLSLSYLGISDITGVEYFSNLKVLELAGNKLKTITHLPTSLEQLNCSDNVLSSLPELPANLLDLNCSHNYLTTLPVLPKSLIDLDCNSNQISRLVQLPENLARLNVTGNKLTVIPSLPRKLEELSCAENNLQILPELPETLSLLWCDDNKLNRLPLLPPSLGYFSCGNNNLTCLPTLPEGIYFGNIDGNNITCLPSHGEWMSEEALKIPICNELRMVNPCDLLDDVSVLVDKSTTGILSSEGTELDDDQMTKGFKMYPNPVKNTLTIDAKGQIDTIKIVDSRGKIKLEVKPAKSHIDLDLSFLANGVYFIHLYVNGQHSAEKMVMAN